MGEAERAFQNLNVTLTSSPVPRNPNFSIPVLVHTDASEMGHGATHSQDFDGEEHSIIFASRKLTSAERCYAAVKQEVLAIKWVLQELRYYLMGYFATSCWLRTTLCYSGCPELKTPTAG